MAVLKLERTKVQILWMQVESFPQMWQVIRTHVIAVECRKTPSFAHAQKDFYRLHRREAPAIKSSINVAPTLKLTIKVQMITNRLNQDQKVQSQ